MTVWRTLWLGLAALIVASVCDAQPIVRVVVRPAGRHLVGQPVHIDVQVLAPNFFLSAPNFPAIDIPGAVVTMPDESGVNLNETIRGVGYAGIQKTYVFVAQSAGTFTLPPLPIAFRYAREPGSTADASVKLPPTAITIEWPAGMQPPTDGSSAVVAKVTIDQRLDRDPAMLHVGEALTRTIVTTAAATQAMFIPPPDLTAPDGVRVYHKDPVLADERQDRVGLVAGHRTDRAVYTFDRPGSYVLPADEVQWFDARRNHEETARAAAVHVTVTAAPAESDAIAPEPPPVAGAGEPEAPARRWALVALGAFVLLATAWTMRGVLNRIGRRLGAWCAAGWAAARRDRARHLPPLNPL